MINKEKITPSADSISEIEKQYPHIAKQLCEYWGDAVFENYANKLIIDERGDRQGLPREVIEELLFLYQLHLKNSNFDPKKVSIIRNSGYLNPYDNENK
jgi:hypothetical protein